MKVSFRDDALPYFHEFTRYRFVNIIFFIAIQFYDFYHILVKYRLMYIILYSVFKLNAYIAQLG